MKINRNVLLSKFYPLDLISALSKSKSFPENVIDAVCTARSGYERINIISLLLENGSPDVLDALRDVSHRGVVESIDPCDVHIKAGKITIKKACHLITCIFFFI